MHKHPARVQEFNLNFGQAHIFYSEATEERCTAAMLLDIDPIKLVRTQDRSNVFALKQYVNDRPYVASSFISVAISQVYGTALNGRCKDRETLTTVPISLESTIAAVPCRGGEGLLQQLFEPLGYEVRTERYQLDTHFPEWGDSHYYTLTLKGQLPLQKLLAHIYVLIPVLDDDKHYWVTKEEIEKLLRFGKGWLSTHPLRELITNRYLVRQRGLTKVALERLKEESVESQEEIDTAQNAEEERIEQPMRLHQIRLDAVLAELKKGHATRVLDAGCGEGRLLRMLLRESQFSMIAGMDISSVALDKAENRLKLDRLSEKQRKRIRLFQGSLLYRDKRLAGFDAITLVEVIEHLELERVATFERVLFEFAAPHILIITTPNQEYNSQWETLPAGKLRHKDHRFEWTRAEFQTWANGVAVRFGYHIEFHSIGEELEPCGPPSQMGVFHRK